jgi:hypothetical protein
VSSRIADLPHIGPHPIDLGTQVIQAL